MTGRSWGTSSIFGSSENHAPARESSTQKSYSDLAHNMDHSFSMIRLREVHCCELFLCRAISLFLYLFLCLLKIQMSNCYPCDSATHHLEALTKPAEQEAVEIAITKLLLKSFYGTWGKTFRIWYLRHLCTSWYISLFR